MKTITTIFLALIAAVIFFGAADAGTAIYYMPFFTTDTANPTYCWIANKSTNTVAATVKIMTSSSTTTPSQSPLSQYLILSAKQSVMVTFNGTTISTNTSSIDISSEIGSGTSTVYSADMTFSSAGTLSCTQLGMSCYQGTSTPKRNLVGYTCFDGTYFAY
ncbi:MAG: hypothetical protein HQK97_07660 [Nitrospirae bacterium]|nr:hypothetical protein [Nitrospirota bacterium]